MIVEIVVVKGITVMTEKTAEKVALELAKEETKEIEKWLKEDPPIAIEDNLLYIREQRLKDLEEAERKYNYLIGKYTEQQIKMRKLELEHDSDAGAELLKLQAEHKNLKMDFDGERGLKKRYKTDLENLKNQYGRTREALQRFVDFHDGPLAAKRPDVYELNIQKARRVLDETDT